jgi:hypothetical protein
MGADEVWRGGGAGSVFVPTNHVYVGDVFLLGEMDIYRTTLSVREGIGALPPAQDAIS